MPSLSLPKAPSRERVAHHSTFWQSTGARPAPIWKNKQQLGSATNPIRKLHPEREANLNYAFLLSIEDTPNHPKQQTLPNLGDQPTPLAQSQKSNGGKGQPGNTPCVPASSEVIAKPSQQLGLISELSQ